MARPTDSTKSVSGLRAAVAGRSDSTAIPLELFNPVGRHVVVAIATQNITLLVVGYSVANSLLILANSFRDA
jgi:hypothetical protein